MKPNIGENIEIYTLIDEQYYSGVVGDIKDRKYAINYVDGDVEVLDIQDEIWKYQEGNCSATNSNNLRIISNEQEVLR